MCNSVRIKKCSTCKEEKPASSEYFPFNKITKDGFDYRCKVCSKKRVTKLVRKKRDTAEGRVYALMHNYRSMDKRKGQYNDLDMLFMLDLTSQPCTYCGNTDKIGADRIDNNKGHEKANVVPCCPECNNVRRDNFTYEEMLQIGRVMKIIMLERNIKANSSSI
jgi:hypothetical protein